MDGTDSGGAETSPYSVDRARVVSDWTAAFGSAPPPRLSVAFMVRAVAHARQCKAHGGLSAASERLLRSAADGKDPHTAPRHSLTEGAQLVREWNGRTYRVDVVEGGYRFDGQLLTSLSAIARRITGTAWSGPRFFGLTDRRRR